MPSLPTIPLTPEATAARALWQARFDFILGRQRYFVPRSVVITFSGPVDDDVRIRIDGRTVYDPQRNIAWYGGQALYPAITLTRAAHGLRNGSLVEIDTFDGWATNWRSSPWSALTTWEDNHTRTFTGGTNTGAKPGLQIDFMAPRPGEAFFAVQKSVSLVAKGGLEHVLQLYSAEQLAGLRQADVFLPPVSLPGYYAQGGGGPWFRAWFPNGSFTLSP